MAMGSRAAVSADPHARAPSYTFHTRVAPPSRDPRRASPIWNEKFQMALPSDRPFDQVLTIRVKNQHLLYCPTIGTCSVYIREWTIGELGEKWVPLTDKHGRKVGQLRLQYLLERSENMQTPNMPTPKPSYMSTPTTPNMPTGGRRSSVQASPSGAPPGEYYGAIDYTPSKPTYTSTYDSSWSGVSGRKWNKPQGDSYRQDTGENWSQEQALAEHFASTKQHSGDDLSQYLATASFGINSNSSGSRDGRARSVAPSSTYKKYPGPSVRRKTTSHASSDERSTPSYSPTSDDHEYTRRSLAGAVDADVSNVMIDNLPSSDEESDSDEEAAAWLRRRNESLQARQKGSRQETNVSGLTSPSISVSSEDRVGSGRSQEYNVPPPAYERVKNEALAQSHFFGEYNPPSPQPSQRSDGSLAFRMSKGTDLAATAPVRAESTDDVRRTRNSTASSDSSRGLSLSSSDYGDKLSGDEYAEAEVIETAREMDGLKVDERDIDAEVGKHGHDWWPHSNGKEVTL